VSPCTELGSLPKQMPTLHDLLPDAVAILALEPEELAGLAMELIASADANSPSRLHPASFTSLDAIGSFPQGERDGIAHALAEGWNWLVREGLLAPKPGDTYGWHFVTRRGMQIKNRQALAAYASAVLLPRGTLFPSLVDVCWPAYMRGDYDTAVFQAFKELEVSIRDAGNYASEDYGVELARKAFHEKTGPLTDTSKPVSERQALGHLMAGALGSYKNPHSHRKVAVGAEEACEMIVLASHLLKIVSSRAKAHAGAP
jgi:uncharacterized protein (TIGR02391 family)